MGVQVCLPGPVLTPSSVLDGPGREPARCGLINADLGLGNVLDYHGQVRPIDFEGASWDHYGRGRAWAYRERT
jgi:hypothetical protein